MILSASESKFWQQHGFIELNNFFSLSERDDIIKWTNDIEIWPETPGKWMKYFESTKLNKKQLCRIENFLQYHQGFNDVAQGKRTIALLSELMGEEAVLFKEKINFKLSGANGFSPHQDYPAFLSFGQSYHITMMLAVDDCTIDNGCL
jgi:2-aminoethylphosphonate dioxygenase